MNGELPLPPSSEAETGVIDRDGYKTIRNAASAFRVRRKAGNPDSSN